MRESISTVLGVLGEEITTPQIETSYGIERAEPLLYLGDERTRDRTVDILYALDRDQAEEAVIRYLTKQQTVAAAGFTADFDVRLDNRLLANNDQMSPAVKGWSGSAARKQLMLRIQAGLRGQK